MNSIFFSFSNAKFLIVLFVANSSLFSVIAVEAAAKKESKTLTEEEAKNEKCKGKKGGKGKVIQKQEK